jgi:hypothetical protein
MGAKQRIDVVTHTGSEGAERDAFEHAGGALQYVNSHACTEHTGGWDYRKAEANVRRIPPGGIA